MLERLTSDKWANLLGQFLSYKENEVLWISTLMCQYCVTCYYYFSKDFFLPSLIFVSKAVSYLRGSPSLSLGDLLDLPVNKVNVFKFKYSKTMLLGFSQVFYWRFKCNTHNNYNYIAKTKWNYNWKLFTTVR